MGEISDDELVSIASEFREGLLDGGSSWMMCAAVSWPLGSYLSVFHGIDSVAVESDLGDMNHVWLRLTDGRALDATADQFNRLFPDMKLPPVYLGLPLASIHPTPSPTSES
jgi:hypothetical protein